MNIALITPWYIDKNSIGGTERFTEDLAISLKELGNNVDIYMLSGKSYKSKGINYISLDLFGKNTIADEYMINKEFGVFDNSKTYEAFAKRIESLVDVSKYDLLQLNSNLFLSLWRNKKRIFTLHSNKAEFMVLGTEKEYNCMLDVMKEEAKNNNTFYICPSEYYSKEWKKILGDSVKCIPHAINSKRLKCNKSKKEILEKYNLSKDKIKILLPSRLEMIQKRPYLVLEALNLLDEKIKNKYQVIFTGIDLQYRNNEKELKKLSEEYKIDSKFIIFDSINEGYKVTDIVCVPSSSESFGYSALEGLYLKKTTILSDIPTYNEFAKESNAIIFGNTKEDLAKVFENIDKYKNKKYDYEVFADKYSMNTFGKSYIGV